MAGNVSGPYVAVAAAGAVLVWSGWKGATIAATVGSLLRGNLDAPATEAVGTAATAGTSASGAVSGSASANYVTIANYLVENGYSKAAAAGICACIAGESSGSPEAVEDPSDPGSGGEGLIQWTPGSSYNVPVTGNASADLQAQLPMIIAYNDAQGSELIEMLNQVSDPVQAADFYSQYFERPKVADSDVVASVATSVYAQITANDSGTATSSGYESPNGYSY